MVRPFRFWIQKVIPLVYDNSLSYYEVLCKVIAKLNEVIETYNSIETNVEVNINQMFEEFEAEWENKINAALAEQDKVIQDGLSTIDAKLQLDLINLENTVQDMLNQQTDANNAAINSLRAYVQTQVNALYEIFNSNNADIRCWVNIQLKEWEKKIPQFQNVTVIDPIDNTLKSLQDTLDHMNQMYRYGGIKAGQFDASFITAEEFDNLHMTAEQFDFESLLFIRPWKNWIKGFNFKTGERQYVQKLIYMLVDFNRVNGLTADEYDALELTVEEYDNFEMTAYDYDWNAKNIIGG